MRTSGGVVRALSGVIVVLAIVGVARHAAAATYTWDAGGGTTAMSNSANWVGDPTVNFLTDGTNSLVFGDAGTGAQPSASNYSVASITFTRGFTIGASESGDAIGIGAGGVTMNAGSGQVTFNYALDLKADSFVQNDSNADFVSRRGFKASSARTITNNGSGTNWLRLTPNGAGLETNATLIQDSPTSRTSLELGSATQGKLDIRRGLLTWQREGNPSTGAIVLGSAAATASDWATLGFRHRFADGSTASATMTVSQPLVLAGTVGTNAIASGKNTYGGSYSAVKQTQIFTGGVTGTNSLYLENVVDTYGDDNIRFTTGSVNMAGKLIHVGSGTGTATIDSVIGANVTEVVQNSVTSKLILGAANLYAGNTTVQAGTLALGAGASIANSAAISVSAGATFDVSALTSGLTIAAGQSLGGAGSILGGLTFGSGSNLDFSSTLTVNSGTVTFNGFGIADILGLDGTVVSAGTYTLLSGNATFDLTNALNVGVGNATDIGGGKSAYLQQGSLQVVVVPEPGALILASVGLAGLAIWSRRRA